ncbi:replication protein C, IncQ-type [Aquariibacter albus]|uniref:Replication C family protein n=1 Tax=Aquariibacter albus TaxID=2759899 RepID=A0A839HTD4_9BURK|nr:replication protein C, IncQ-type [Aquariibacter albus]MBB1162689.1 replication C family protein [Aquariibacter albus]
MTRTAGKTTSAPPRVVRLSHPFGLCQLFRPLPKDGSPRPVLNETYQYGELSLRFSAREALGVPEQTLLLALLELAQEQHRRRPSEHRLDQADRSEVGSLLWSSLHLQAEAGAIRELPPTLRLECSWSELHRRCGSASVGGSANDVRRESLARLCEVTVWERDGATHTVRSCRLVSWLVGDNQRVHVALNHRLAAALLSPGYAQVLLSERLTLPSHTAMLVHAFLSTCLGQGKSMSIGYETLVERLWPSTGTPPTASKRKRRLSDVTSAVRAIGRLESWKVQLAPTVAEVTRMKSSACASNGRPAARAEPREAREPMPAAREMTRPSHFALSTSSYGEQPFWQKLSSDKPLPRNDEASTTL